MCAEIRFIAPGNVIHKIRILINAVSKSMSPFVCGEFKGHSHKLSQYQVTSDSKMSVAL